jgi:hypothetical protein
MSSNPKRNTTYCAYTWGINTTCCVFSLTAVFASSYLHLAAAALFLRRRCLADGGEVVRGRTGRGCGETERKRGLPPHLEPQ